MNAINRLSRTGFALAFLTLGSFVTTAAGAQGPTPARDDQNSESTAQVRDLFRKGSVSFKAKNYEEARATFLQAWAIRQTPDVAAMLGQTELFLQRHRDAAEHLDYCLRNVPAAESEAFISKVRVGFEKAKAQIGIVRVAVDRDGAEVRLDGRMVGTSPIKQLLFVEPGEHLVEASLNGTKASDPVNAEAGREFSAEITLANARTNAPNGIASSSPIDSPSSPKSLPETSPPNPQPSAFVPTETSHRSVVPLVVGGAVIAVGLGTGIGFRIAASSKYNDARAQSNTNGTSACYGLSSGGCSAQRDAVTKVDQFRNVSTVGFIAAGIAAVAVPVYWFWPRSSERTPALAMRSLQLHSSVNREGSGLWLSGDF